MDMYERLHLLTGQEAPVIGYGSAHPDDLIMHGLAAYESRQASIPSHELVMTYGEKGINYRTGPETESFDVTEGHRRQEGEATADFLGVKTYSQHDFGDGQLTDRLADPIQARELIATMSGWIVSNEVSILAVSSIGDHDDHSSVAKAGLLAASRLAAEDGYNIALMKLLPDSRRHMADFSVPTSIDAIQTVMGAAAINRSQFHVTNEVRSEQGGYTHAANWPVVGGYHVDVDTLRRLSPYPLRKSAPYQLHTTETLRVGYAALSAILETR